MDGVLDDLVVGRKEIPQIVGGLFLVEHVIVDWDGELYLLIL